MYLTFYTASVERLWARFDELLAAGTNLEAIYAAMIALYARCKRPAKAAELTDELNTLVRVREIAEELAPVAEADRDAGASLIEEAVKLALKEAEEEAAADEARRRAERETRRRAKAAGAVSSAITRERVKAAKPSAAAAAVDEAAKDPDARPA